jgi:hypothetical protein
MGGVIYGGTQGDVSVPILIPFKSEFDLFCEWKRKKPVKFTPRIIIVRTVSEPVLIIFLWGVRSRLHFGTELFKAAVCR